MAVLGLDGIKKRVKKSKLVENLGERDLNNPEGVGLDLRLGSLHKIIEGFNVRIDNAVILKILLYKDR